MGGGELQRIRNGSVRAAIDMFGQKNYEVNPADKKSQTIITEKSSSKARELYMARSEIGRYKESRSAAASAMEQAELELYNAKKTVKYLNSLIEESKSRTNAQKNAANPERAHVVDSAEYNEYVELLKELEKSKQELAKLKHDMGSVLEEKSKLEKEFETYSKKESSQFSAVEMLRKEMEEVNEELVLVELAHIEAMKELSAVEAQRENEESLYLSELQVIKKKVSQLTEEIDRSKKIEAELEATSSDIEVLKNELDLIKDKKCPSPKVNYSEEVESAHQLKIAANELEAAKKELEAISKESVDCMAFMDITRYQLKDILEKTAQLKRTEEKVELKVQTLNSKLWRAKFKLDAVSATAEKASSFVSNLSLTLENLKKEIEAARKEKFTLGKETERVKAETCRFDGALNIAEERLKGEIDNLEAAKSSESRALENLKILIEKIMKKRNTKSQNKSFITISKFEYEYLTGRAIGAEEIADKKIAAAQAWIDALKASEKEISMHIEKGKREISQISVEEEQVKSKTGMKREEFNEKNQEYWEDPKRRNPYQGYSRRSMNVKRTSFQQAKRRVSGSPLARGTSFSVKKRTNVMPSLVKYFNSKRNP